MKAPVSSMSCSGETNAPLSNNVSSVLTQPESNDASDHRRCENSNRVNPYNVYRSCWLPIVVLP
jgi:hypothetical protein